MDSREEKLKQKEELRKLRGERLLSCLNRYNMKQKDLAVPSKKNGYTICDTSAVSKWINGQSKLTEGKIDDLLREIPQFRDVRKEYLLGDDPFMTQEDLANASALENPMKEFMQIKTAELMIINRAFEEVCSSEGIPVPKPTEFIKVSSLLSAQLESEARKIAWSYLHRDTDPLHGYIERLRNNA